MNQEYQFTRPETQRNIGILNNFDRIMRLELTRLRVNNHANTKQGLINPTVYQVDEIANVIERSSGSTKEIQLYTHWGECQSLCKGCDYTKVIGHYDKLAVAIAKQIKSEADYLEEKVPLILYNGGGTASLRLPNETRIIYSALQQSGLRMNKTIEINNEGSGSHFTKERVKKEIEIRNEYFPNAIIRWSVGGFGEKIEGRSEAVDSCLQAIPIIKKTCQDAHIESIVNVDFVIGNTDFDINKTILNMINAMNAMYNSGVSENRIVGQITIYGMRNCITQESSIGQYLDEYFELLETINKWVDQKNANLVGDEQLCIEFGPKTLGGSWFTIKKNKTNTNFYIQDRWSMFDNDGGLRKNVLKGYGNSGYSTYCDFDKDSLVEDIKYIRTTADANIYNYLDHSSDFIPNTKGLLDRHKIRILNQNYKTAQEFHTTGKYFDQYTIGMDGVNESLRFLHSDLYEQNEFGVGYFNLIEDDYTALRERLMSLLDVNSAFYNS
jgi:uncharacterized protein Usg